MQRSLEQIAEAAPLGVAIISSDGRYRYINTKFTEIFGYTLKDIPNGRVWFRKAFPEPAYREHVIATWISDLRGAHRWEPRARTFIVRCKDGNDKLIYFIPILMESGDHFVIYDDITERERAHQELQRHNELLEVLVRKRTAELSSTITALQKEVAERKRVEETLRAFQVELQEKNDSLELLHTFANSIYGSLNLTMVAERAVAFMMNYTGSPIACIFTVDEETSSLQLLHMIGLSEEAKEQLAIIPLGNPFSQAICSMEYVSCTEIPHSGHHCAALASTLYKLGIKGGISIPLTHHDRPIAWLAALYRDQPPPLTDLQRKTLAHIGRMTGSAMANARAMAQIKAKVVERRLTEEKLQRDRENLYEILQAVPNGVALIDMEGRILYLNPEFSRITGYHKKDIPTIEDWQRQAFGNSEIRQMFSDFLKSLSEQGGGRIFTITCKDSRLKEIEFHRAVLQDDRIIITLSDITERVKTEEKLRLSELRYRTLFEGAPDAIFVHDLEGNFLDVNFVACHRYGYQKEEFWGMKIKDILPEGAKDYDVSFANGSNPRSNALHETIHVSKDGRLLTVEVSSRVIEYGTRQAVLSIARDITERKKIEAALRESEDRIRRLFEAIPEAVIVHDEDGNIIYINDVAAKRLEWQAEELKGKTLQDIIKKENAPLIPEHVRIARRDGSCTFETTYISKTGRAILAEVNESPIELEGKGVILSVARDITERKRTERQLAYMATHDALTGLPNRLLFNDRLTIALAQAQRHRQRLAVFLLDIDRFKDINDTLGHSVGDGLLRQAARRLKGLLRRSDTLARMGGDEFLCLITDIVHPDQAGEVAKKILDAFREPYHVEGHALSTTISIGGAIFPEDGMDADTLLKNADIAMYRAKQGGRNDYQRYGVEHK